MIVADASVVIEALLGTPLSKICLTRLTDPSHQVCVPAILDIEVVQVIRRYVLYSEITSERGREAVEDFLELPIIRYPHEPLLHRIWELRDNCTAYDAAYIALSEALSAPLITCDARLAGSPGHSAEVEVIR